MRCGKCGAELLPNDFFCGSCGAKVGAYTDGGTASKPIIVLGEDEKTPYSDLGKVPNSKSSFSSSGTENNRNKPISQATKNGKSKTNSIVAVLVIVLFMLMAFTVFNFLLMTDRIDTFKYEIFEGYKESLAEFLNLPYETERNTVDFEDQSETTELVTAQQTTAPTTSVPTTTEIDPSNYIPAELQQYASGLAYEGRTYRITLQEDDWYINYRSTPQLIVIGKTDNNILGKMKHGSEIYVEYIYNGTWAVFYKDGQYVFSSLYASNNPSLHRLMEAL